MNSKVTLKNAFQHAVVREQHSRRARSGGDMMNDKKIPDPCDAAIFLLIEIAVFFSFPPSRLSSKVIYRNKSRRRYYKPHGGFPHTSAHFSFFFLAWLNIGLCIRNIDTQRGEIWISHICLCSLFCCFSADGSSARGTEQL